MINHLIRISSIILLLLIGLDGFSQIRGKVSCEGVPVAYAHLMVASTGYMEVTDELGEFYLPSGQDKGSLIVSSIGYKTLRIELSKSDIDYLTIELEKEVYTIGTVTIEEKESTAKEMLKRAKKKATSMWPKDNYYLKGRVGEFSMNDSSFAHVIEGDFLWSIPPGKPTGDVKVEILYESKNYREPPFDSLGGISFKYHFRQGKPSRLITNWHLKHARKDGIVLHDGFPVMKIICQAESPVQRAVFYVRIEDDVLVEAQEDLVGFSNNRSSLANYPFWWRFLTFNYHFKYKVIDEQLFLIAVNYEAQKHYYTTKEGPVALDQTRFVKIRVHEAHTDGAVSIPEDQQLRIPYWMQFAKNVPIEPWEKQPFVQSSTFRQQVLKDLEKQSTDQQ